MWPASDSLLARRYQLDDRIAAGGFGEVWRGRDTVLARLVAIKLLHPGHSAHPEMLERFRAEARNAGALGHENIARVYDYGEPDPRHPPFLVMEFVDGPSLAAVLAGGPLSPARTLDIVAQTAAGLHAAHLAGVVHRDIKPGNLLLAPGSQVKITDFGISHSIGSAPVTSTGMLLGTAGYLAPEQVAGSRATSKSDLYSLGVVAYECLAGAPPFAGPQLEVALAHRDRPLPPLPDTVPVAVAALVDQLTAKDPAQRPESAGVVASQAAWLRDRMAGAGHQLDGLPAAPVAAPSWTTPGLAAAGSWSPDRAPADQTPGAPPGGSPTLVGAAPGPLSGPDEPAPGLQRGGRRAGRIAALAAAAVVVAVTGWVLAGWLGAARQPPAAGPGRSAPSLSTAKMVHVRTDALIGRPVTAVTRQLHELGLVVQVRWQPSAQQAPGMVVSVLPGGWVRSGSTVAVTGALRTAASTAKGAAHGHGTGHGHGKGHGRGPGRGTAAGPGSSPGPGPSSPPSPSAGATTPAGASPPATPSPSAPPTNQPTPDPSPTTSTAAGGNSSR